MEILDARETGARLPHPELADSIREVMNGRREGKLDAPSRLVLPLPEGGNLLVMPAADDELAITKLVTVHPGNARRELPTIQGEVVVMEARTGMGLGILDGGAATARRTAALSLLAARTLTRCPDGPLLIVGAGTQARSHLEAFREGLGVSKVLLTSRTTERAVSLAEHARSLGMDARVVDGPQEALDEVSLIVTATTSGDPVLPEKVPEGVFVAAVGAFDPEMAELAPGLVEAPAWWWMR
jgi:1-piperideine-2-carboxylate/1-pyrroline-2-carboxylate reductase [NAD(P)H]